MYSVPRSELPLIGNTAVSHRDTEIARLSSELESVVARPLPPKPRRSAFPVRPQHPAPSAVALADDARHMREVALATRRLFEVLNAGFFNAEFACAGRGGKAAADVAKAAAAALKAAAALAAAAAAKQALAAAKQAVTAASVEKEAASSEAANKEEAKRAAAAQRGARAASVVAERGKVAAAAVAKEAAAAAVGGKRKATGPADRVGRADGKLQGQFLRLEGAKWRVLSVAWSVEFNSVMAWYYNVESAAGMQCTHAMMEQAHEGALATEHPVILVASVDEIRFWAAASQFSGGI